MYIYIYIYIYVYINIYIYIYIYIFININIIFYEIYFGIHRNNNHIDSFTYKRYATNLKYTL